MTVNPTATLLVAPSKTDVATVLTNVIVQKAAQALEARGAFTVALSGGSLPSMLSTLESAFAQANITPHFDQWHVILADERCVPQSHPDSNYGSLQQEFFSKLSSSSSPGIPPAQIHGLDESKLSNTDDNNNNDSTTTEDLAMDYQTKVESVLHQVSGGQLDLAVLGFGPDGHTCSLFPNHPLLHETKRTVAGLDDSPKPPPSRITLTLPVLNQRTRHVIFCGTGSSKSPVLQAILSNVVAEADEKVASSPSLTVKQFAVEMASPPPLPCAMVQPNIHNHHGDSTLTWIVDDEAMQGVMVTAT
ncbi:hypothetical protein ACA910_021814 [Epithemia clementina (nom. ined.)]